MNPNLTQLFAQMGEDLYNFSEQHVEYGALITLDEDERGNISMAIQPDDPYRQGLVAPFRLPGKVKVSTDGTAYITASRSKRSKATPIELTDHGRLSHTVDNHVQLTLKFPLDGSTDIPQAFAREVFATGAALDRWIAVHKQNTASPRAKR